MTQRLFRLVALITIFSLLLVACDSNVATPTQVAVPTNTTAAQPAQPTDTTAPAAPTATTAPAAPTNTTAPAAPTATAGASTGGQQFAGVTVNLLTFTGPQIAEPLQRHAPEFEKLTGAKINVVTVPFSDLYQKVLTDLTTKTNSYQAFVFDPQWMADFVTPGFLEDLSSRVTADKAIDWQDIAPFFRDFSATFQGKTYTIPLDGDFLMVYYRSDLLEKDGIKPPATWQDYLDIAKKYNGTDLNGDGAADYGSCISKKRSAQAYWFIDLVAGGYLQSLGTGQGAFFDPDTMQPLIDNEGFRAALDVYKATTQYAPPDELNLDVGDTRGLFTSGRCALSMDWGDIGTLAIDPATSKVQDKVGAVIAPGSKQVVDRATGKLVDCSATTCPFAIDGVNHAPFAAFGGWSGAINAAADQKVKDAAYAFLSYVSAPAQSNVDVTIGKTGFNPYRTSQFDSTAEWTKAGMSEKAAQLYLGAIKDSLNSPNMVLDLRVPLSSQYQQVVLDKAIAQFLAGEIDQDEAVQQITDGWNQITDQAGRDTQGAAYKASLGIRGGSATAATATPAPAGDNTQFAGVTVNLLTFTGPQIAEPLQRHAPEFEKLTGAKINVVTVPFSDLYQKVLTDLTTKTNSYQAFVFDPQWMADFVTPGFLEDMSSKVTADKSLDWQDIAPFFRDFSATFQGKVYTIPLDGDFLMVYYRSDLLEKDGIKPPATWQDYLDIAKKYNGTDLNGDGAADYGSCISKKRSAQAYWFIELVAGGYLQSQGTGQGLFFDPTTMQPLIDNEGFRAALDVYKATTQYAPPDELNLDVGDTRGLFTTGRCALSMDWGDIGTLAIDPATSKVQDKVGAVIAPGSKQVVDRATGKLVDCNATTCPHAIDGVNHAPFAAFGGWSGAINAAADQKVKDAAYAFLSYVSAPAQSNVDVTIGKTGFNPYRTSQFNSTDLWVKAGMSEKAAQLYLGAIKDSLNSPNMVLDLRVPLSSQYQQVVLDKAIAQFLAGEIDQDEAVQQITDGWNQITDQAGRDTQGAAYKASLGVQR